MLCLLNWQNILSQTGRPETAAAAGVAEISLARSDGNGKAGEAATNFITTDVPIYCLIRLASVKAATVKMNVVLVAAAGLKPERIVVAVVYKTDGKQTGVTFTASPERVWTAGAYRADIFLDGKAARSIDFEIKKTPGEIEKQTRGFPKAKPKTKLKKLKESKS